jgi:hypothetical protein
MPDSGGPLKTVLDGFATFLTDKEFALRKHQPYLVRWVREFLHLAPEHGGYTFEQTLDLLLADVGARGGIEPWQVQQAADAENAPSAGLTVRVSSSSDHGGSHHDG